MRHRVTRLFVGRLKGRRGFTLIEGLAAFAILTAVLGQLLAGVSGAARNESRADFLERAARQGTSQLESLGADGSMPLGSFDGRYDDGLLWRLVVQPADAIASQGGGPKTTSYAIKLMINRPDGEGGLTLTTVKIVSVGAPNNFQATPP
jgi:type II secretory pathway pseudopilin PulG